MKIIKLTNGYEAIVDDEDYEVLNKWKWRVRVSDTPTPKAYAYRSFHIKGVGGKNISMHRFILGLKKGELGDHINGNSLDNRRCNLRKADHKINGVNRAKDVVASSRYYGVHKRKGYYYKGWHMQIRRGKMRIYQYFPEERWAAMAHDLWCGPYAPKNFPDALGKFDD